MQPGQLFFEHFGHDAIIVADPISGQSLSYNFGYFDPWNLTSSVVSSAAKCFITSSHFP